jgi:hypothetical protein
MRTISASIALLLLLPLIPKAQNGHLIDSIRVIAAAAKGHTGVVIREGVHQPVRADESTREAVIARLAIESF